MSKLLSQARQKRELDSKKWNLRVLGRQARGKKILGETAQASLKREKKNSLSQNLNMIIVFRRVNGMF